MGGEKTWLFNGPKFKTSAIDHGVPEEIQLAIWSYIESRRNQQIPLDYLQVFKLRVEKVGKAKMQIIECVQEQPEHIQSFSFPFELAMEEKIFVIDDVDHLTMLLSREY